MAGVSIIDLEPGAHAEAAYCVGTCTRVHESEEIDACARRRQAWLERKYPHGVRVKVALVEGDPAGFAYVMPITVSPWGRWARTWPCCRARWRMAE